MRLIFLITAAGLALLTACAPRYSSLTERAAAEGACDARPAQVYVGQLASQEIAQRIQHVTRARLFEWIEPDMIVTTAFSQWRVRVTLNGEGRIAEITCG